MLNTILTITGITITVIIVIVLLSKRFIYFKPSHDIVGYPESFKEISDGTLIGWILNGENTKAILFCHGNAGNISHRINKITQLNNLGYTVLIFDYSGYGKSEGVPSEQQCYQDASIFVHMLAKLFSKKNIIIYGESLGAAIAANIGLRFGIETLILESSLPSVKKYIKHKMKYLYFLAFLFPEFNTEKFITSYNGRVLLLHSVTDEIIPYESTQTLRNIVTTHIPIKGTHNQPIIPWKEIKTFIESK